MAGVRGTVEPGGEALGLVRFAAQPLRAPRLCSLSFSTNGVDAISGLTHGAAGIRSARIRGFGRC